MLKFKIISHKAKCLITKGMKPIMKHSHVQFTHKTQTDLFGVLLVSNTEYLKGVS